MSETIPGPAQAQVPWSNRSGLRFIVLFGVVSLFADMAYEGARSITGPFLASLGASGFVVGAVSGAGEMLGYAVRLISGRAADRKGRYWPITLGGYIVQLPAVPLLALAFTWPVAGLLIVVERIGKGVRNPVRGAMLAKAGEDVGVGWGFGIHEAMDKGGALIGPLVIGGILALWPNDYRRAFAWLAIPVAAALLTLFFLRLAFPAAGQIARSLRNGETREYPRSFWWYSVGAGLLAFGFSDFPLIAYHFAKARVVSGLWIPIFYALALGSGGVGSLLIGRLFDRVGLIVLIPVTILTASFAPLVFLGGFDFALTGALLWGIGLGAHESVMSAAVARMFPQERRSTAYGIFMAIFGAAWFIGSAVQGALYDVSIPALVATAIAAQAAGVVPVWIAVRRAGL
ncbi:MAG TPA: MFS transporter [Syntrophobacteraceae bacterium]|nr:MFS transporter [Syntrophobacteraceae bacterium]